MILIQPERACLAEYKAFGLPYELLEPSMPGQLDTPLEECWRGRDVRVMHGAFVDVNPASNDPLIRAASQTRCRQSCERAKALGAGAVVFHTGCFPYITGAWYGDGWAGESAAFYEALIHEFDLDIHVENSLDRSPDLLLKLMQRRQSGRLKVCLDVGHIHYSPTPDEVWFSALGPYVGQLHLSDNLGLMDDHLPLGEGSCHWEGLSTLCAALPTPPGYVTLEVGGPESIRKSLAFLQKNHYVPLGGERNG